MKLSKLKYLIDESLKRDGDKEVEVSVDISTGEKDYDHRIFADVIYLVNQNEKWSIECNKIEDNYK
jgi:hypothetical protein